MPRSWEGFFPIRSKSAQGRPTGVSVLTRTFLKQNSDGEFNEAKFWRTRKASFKEVKSDSRLWKSVPVLSSVVYCSNVFLLACCREQAPVLRFSSVFVSCTFTCPKGMLPPPSTKAGSSLGNLELHRQVWSWIRQEIWVPLKSYHVPLELTLFQQQKKRHLHICFA